MLGDAFDLEVLRAAHSVLAIRWAATFAAIVGTGSVLPWLLNRFGFGLTRRHRQVTSLAAMAICLYSIPLLVDTFNIERESAGAFSTQSCNARGAEITCPVYEGPLPGGYSAQGPGVLFELRYSGVPVHFRPTSLAGSP